MYFFIDFIMSEMAITCSLSDPLNLYFNAYEMESTESTIHKVHKTLKKTPLFSKQFLFAFQITTIEASLWN